MASTNEVPQPIIDLILADINAILSNLSILVTAYRLLVGGAEEIRRTPDVCPEVFERAERRADNAGTLIDIFLDLLYCKMIFSSDFLKISGAPVDLFRLLANPNTATDIPFHTAEQVVEIEILRKILETFIPEPPSMPQHTIICPKPVIPSPVLGKPTDVAQVESALLTALQAQLATPSQPQVTVTRDLPIESRVRRKHLKDPYNNFSK